MDCCGVKCLWREETAKSGGWGVGKDKERREDCADACYGACSQQCQDIRTGPPKSRLVVGTGERRMGRAWSHTLLPVGAGPTTGYGGLEEEERCSL